MKQQKHLALLLGCSLILTTCIMPAPKASAAKIKLNKKNLTLEVKQSYTLKLKNCKKKIKWSSSKKKIATVSSKGKVKAKKVGKTTITAKVGKKKYKCKVTVKKASNTKPNQTPKNTKAPQTTAAPQTPQPTATAQTPDTSNPPSPSATPDLSPEGLMKNVSVDRQVFPEHILLTVTNNNSVWLDSVIVTYEYYGLDNTSIASGYEELFYLRAGESQYIAIPTTMDETINNLDTEDSFESIEVTGPNSTGLYTNQTDKLEILEEEVDYDAAYLLLTVKNHSPLDVRGNYLIYFYDANNTVLDVESKSIDLYGKDQQEESIDIPARSTNYKIQQYSSASFEEIDDDTMLEKGIYVVAEKLADCLLVTVSNNNSQWLKSVDIDYEFYDAEDDFLFSDSGSLLSMAPTETQYLIIEADSDDIAEIDLGYSVANITLEKADSNVQYQNTSLVTVSIESNRDNEEDEEGVEDTDDMDMDMDEIYTITFTNGAALPVDGSYIVYFRNSKGDIITARQDTLSISANNSYSATIDMPLLYDQHENLIPLSPLMDSDIQIFIHTYTENSENQ